MTTLGILDATALTISGVLAATLALMVLSSGARRALNLSFALFALSLTASSTFDVIGYLIQWLGRGNSALWVELTYVAQTIIGPLLLAFTTLYLNRRSRWSDLAVGLGLAVMAALCVPLFRHQLIVDPHLIANGTFDADLNTLGLVWAQVSAVYILWSLVLFWQERRQTQEPYLALGTLILMAGFALEGGLATFFPISSVTTVFAVACLGYGVISRQIFNPLRELTEELERKVEERTQELERAYAEVEKQVEEQTAELRQQTVERERLQQEIIAAQQSSIQELSTPVIPIMDTPQGSIIVMPLIGSIDSMRAKDITRRLLAGIREHRATVVILDITGVAIVDSGVANHLNKTIQAARLKGAHTIITGISDAVAEAIVDLGIDWGSVETLSDLQTGLVAALNNLGFKLTR